MNKYSQLALIFVGVLCLTESSTSFSMPSAFLELWTKDAKGHGNPLDNMQSYSYSLKDDEVCHDSNIIDYGLRLIGCENEVARQAGRLEIFYKGSWGTICDDQFDKYDAQVACYSLGYERYQGLPVKNTFYDGPTGSLIALDDVACTGNETVLDECDHANWELSNCAHSEDIGLACVPQEIDGVIHYGHPTRLVNGNENITNTGRLEIFHRGEWGTVCDDDFGHIDAAIACRALYLNFATGMFIRNEYGPGTGRIWLDTVTCTEDDINIGTCAHDPWGVHDCNHEEDVSIICGQCFDELCQNNSTCRDADTAGCQCQPGYTGMYCETRAEDCSQAACANGGTCFMFMNRWMCNCPVGYTGTFCETQMPSTITTIAPTTTSTDQQGTREQGTRDWSRETTREWTRETTREWPREVESTTANTEITPTSTPPRSSSDNWTW